MFLREDDLGALLARVALDRTDAPVVVGSVELARQTESVGFLGPEDKLVGGERVLADRRQRGLSFGDVVIVLHHQIATNPGKSSEVSRCLNG